MPKLITLFNHTLTDAQRADVQASLGADLIIDPPLHLSHIWSHVPPELEILSGYLDPVCKWLEETALPGDFVLIQGEFGATFLLVSFCLKRGLIPVYSTTRRQAVEKHLPDGTVRMEHVFCHVRFRRYGQ